MEGIEGKEDDGAMIGILGAGPAGLCAAINLAKRGENARVFERRAAPGMRFHPNLQGLRHVNEPPEKFMESLGIRSKIGYRHFSKGIICTRKREIHLGISGGGAMPFVLRGGRGSLEHALYCEAEKLGVEFEFNSQAKEKDVKIVASGMRHPPDAAALGTVFEDTDFPRDTYLVMFDDRYSPKGWYSYIVPISQDEIEFVTCVSREHIPDLAAIHAKAMAGRRIIRDFVAGKRKIASFGGAGAVRFPKSAIIGGKYYAGEAAGFQDPYMGFGIVYALRSGKIAADCLLDGSDYDAAWKKSFLHYFKKDIAYRLPMSLFGDRMAEIVMGKYVDGENVNLSAALPDKNPLYGAAAEAAFHLEMLKFGITGGW